MMARSYLYVPADRHEVVAKSGQRGADAVILDLEDGVAPGRKDQGREVASMALGEGIDGAQEIWARVSSPRSSGGDPFAADLQAVLRPGLSGVLIAKCDSAAELEWAITQISSLRVEREIESDLDVGALIESAAGLLACEAMASLPGLARLQLGEADLAASLGLDVSSDESELLPARHRVVVCAAAAGLDPPVGPVSTELGDLGRLRQTTERLRRLGFLGRAVIHPRQIDVVNEVFTPSPERIEAAKRVVETFEEAIRDGRGALVDDAGQMVDEAVVRSSRRVLDLGHRYPRPR
jgi:citrate lyase subunit beta / citryl-CoA lyase